MDIRTATQTILDNVLLPHGVISNHLRRVKTDSIEGSTVKVNNDEYVVYRVISSRPRIYGDGVARLSRTYVDVSYYYSYEKTDPRYAEVEKRINAVKAAFLGDGHFRVANDKTDMPDIDSDYRGINLEFSHIGACDNG